MSAITKVPEEGFAEKVATSERDGFILKITRFSGIGPEVSHYDYCYRIYLDSYIKDALGNIIGATIKYQTSTDWVKKDKE